MRVGLLILVILMVLVSCQKNRPETILPTATSTGEQTLGFLLNNEVWLPYDRGSHEVYELPKPSLSAEGQLKISATRIDETNNARNWFCIEVERGCAHTGIYPLTGETCHAPYQTYYYGANKDKTEEVYQIDTLQPHFVEVFHLDTLTKTISGLFQFDAISNQDTIRVHSGRFDLNYER
jgi:hypothetical protein